MRGTNAFASPWGPVIILGVGTLLTFGAAKQRALPLERSLQEVVPTELEGYVAQDLGISPDEAEVAGFNNYLLRVYEAADTLAAIPWFSLYVGYYESQTQGSTIHSPKNCLPGAGWEALSSEVQQVEVGDRTVAVNHYLLQSDTERALVLYWYQGRGRIAHNEYAVKWDLIRDAALRRRSDEALVRVVVPWTEEGDVAAEFATAVASEIIPRIELALPD